MIQFEFMNIAVEPQIEEGRIILESGEKADFFNFYDINEKQKKKVATAPFMFTEITGDFIASAKVSLDFKDSYDSAVLMIMQDSDIWAKACYELTDFGKTSVVSVVTNQFSDDANGNNVTTDSVYLKAIRVNNDFAFHYSIDGKQYEMMRFFHLDVMDTLKVGLVAQSPLGTGTTCVFEEFTIDNKTAMNIRRGE